MAPGKPTYLEMATVSSAACAFRPHEPVSCLSCQAATFCCGKWGARRPPAARRDSREGGGGREGGLPLLRHPLQASPSSPSLYSARQRAFSSRVGNRWGRDNRRSVFRTLRATHTTEDAAEGIGVFLGTCAIASAHSLRVKHPVRCVICLQTTHPLLTRHQTSIFCHSAAAPPPRSSLHLRLPSSPSTSAPAPPFPPSRST
jgi:hypothetical protein